MSVVTFIVGWVAIAVFAIAVVVRVAMWRKMPIHMRWELYPVMHEKHAEYGGSYYENVDWWKKPRETSMLAEVKAMFMEIVFLVALKESNETLWKRSFPFHFGLYLVAAATGTMIGYGVLVAIFSGLASGGFATLVLWLVRIFAYSGLILSIVGAIGLLERRLNDPGLPDYSAPADFFNLIAFIAVFGLVLLNVLVNDRGMEASVLYVYGLVTFNTTLIAALQLNVLFVLSIVLAGALLAYIPMTHMSHFIGKYFAYHSIRWNDEPNLKGSKHEGPIREALNRPVSWSAPHIKGDGKKTWADVATASGREEEKR